MSASGIGFCLSPSGPSQAMAEPEGEDTTTLRRDEETHFQKYFDRGGSRFLGAGVISPLQFKNTQVLNITPGLSLHSHLRTKTPKTQVFSSRRCVVVLIPIRTLGGLAVLPCFFSS